MYKLEDIPIGAENAISRKTLAAIWNLSDRETRRIVADLRTIDDGTDYVIVSVSRGKGYYRTQDIDQIKHFINEMTKLIRNTFRAIKTAKRILRRLEQLQEYQGANLEEPNNGQSFPR